MLRTTRALSVALLAATPISAAALMLPGLAPFPKGVATVLPFLLASTIGAIIARRRRAGLPQAAYVVEARIGRSGTVTALAEQIDLPSPGPMAAALWKSLDGDLPADGRAFCRWAPGPILWALPAVPALLTVAALLAPCAPSGVTVEGADLAARRNIDRARRLLDRIPAAEPDIASDVLADIGRIMQRKAKARDITGEARNAVRRLERDASEATKHIKAVDRVRNAHPRLAQATASQRTGADDGLLEAFAGRLNGMAGEEKERLRKALDQALSTAAGAPSLEGALRELKTAVTMNQARRFRRAMNAALAFAREAKQRRSRLEFARNTIEGAIVRLEGTGGRTTVSTGQRPPPAAAPTPRQPGRHFVPARTSAELIAKTAPRWERRFDPLVRRYFDRIGTD